MSVNNLLKDEKLKYKMLSFMLLILVLVAIGYSIHLRGDNDDLFFYHALDKKSLIEFLVFRYKEWSGRVILEAIMVSTIKVNLFWKLSIPLSFLLLCYSIHKIIFKDTLDNHIGVIVAAGLCLLIGMGIRGEAVLWVTGFYNYLLPISLGMFAVMVLKNKEKYSGMYLVLSILCLFVACYNEQVAVSIFALSLIIVMTRVKEKTSIKFDLFFIFFAILNSAVLFLAHGNYDRFIQETITWLPEFHDYTVLQKITLGVDRMSEHLHSSADNKIFQISFFLSILLLIKEKISWKIKSVMISIFILNIVVFFLLHFRYLSDYIVWMPYISFLSPENWSSYEIYISYFISFITIVSIIATNMCISKKWATLIELSSYPLLGFMTIIMLGFSPTVYASGTRILYLCDIFFIMYVCALLRMLQPDFLRNVGKIRNFAHIWVIWKKWQNSALSKK